MDRRLAFLAILVPLLAGGCTVDLGEAPFFCCKDCDPQCPEGYECKGNYCVKKGTCPEFVPECKTTSSCGNGKCDPGEDATSCPADCGSGTCGDGKCEPSESCTSCPKDCGTCPQTCGNGKCDPGENATNCPADCGSTTCGNGKCDPGEDATSCPADCGSTTCVQDETKCEGTTAIKYCDNNAWKTETCDNVCTSGQYDYSAGCEFSTDKNKDVCLCGNYGTFGSLCDDQILCDPSLFCGTLETGKPGFCSKACTNTGGYCTGAPAGTTAQCVLETSPGQYACGFTCDYLGPCPAGMQCDSLDYLCKPQ
jgi:hypothetical protein